LRDRRRNQNQLDRFAKGRFVILGSHGKIVKAIHYEIEPEIFEISVGNSLVLIGN
jgi:hypothetical protein